MFIGCNSNRLGGGTMATDRQFHTVVPRVPATDRSNCLFLDLRSGEGTEMASHTLSEEGLVAALKPLS